MADRTWGFTLTFFGTDEGGGDLAPGAISPSSISSDGGRTEARSGTLNDDGGDETGTDDGGGDEADRTGAAGRTEARSGASTRQDGSGLGVLNENDGTDGAETVGGTEDVTGDGAGDKTAGGLEWDGPQACLQSRDL